MNIGIRFSRFKLVFCQKHQTFIEINSIDVYWNPGAGQNSVACSYQDHSSASGSYLTRKREKEINFKSDTNQVKKIMFLIYFKLCLDFKVLACTKRKWRIEDARKRLLIRTKNRNRGKRFFSSKQLLLKRIVNNNLGKSV